MSQLGNINKHKMKANICPNKTYVVVKGIDLKQTILSVNEKRVPLNVSFRQNILKNTNNVHNKNKPIVKKRETRVNRIGFKRSKVINDENAENKTDVDSKLIGRKSKILNETFNKNQIIANKEIKLKYLSQISSSHELKYAKKEEFSSNLIPLNVESIDVNDTNNVFLCPDYVNEIYRYFRQLENSQKIKQNFLSIQPEMTSRMRSVLIDWLICVHNQFNLLPETLYLAISIMDRYFQKEVITKEQIQLVGVTAFFIASKFQESYPPNIELKDFVMICDKRYNKKDIIVMELSILNSLKFELCRPLPLDFLRRNSKAAHVDSRIHTLAKYLMELILVEYECAHWNPSLLASTSLYVSLKIFGDITKWTTTLEFYSGYTQQQLLSSASQICKIIIKSENSKFQNCRQKYSSEQYLKISQIPQLKSSIIYKIAAFDGIHS